MLKKRAIWLFLIACFITHSHAQKQPESKSVVQMIDTGTTLPIRERLVQLAMQNPELEIADSRIAIAEYELKKTKTKALNNIAISGNLNEFTLKGSTTGTNQFFPRYNIGATLPLDLFFTRSNEIKIAKENIHITNAEKNARYRQVRSMVLIAYEDYLMHKEMLEFQSQITQDSYTSFLKSEKDFSDAIIPQEEYNKAFKAYSDEQTKKITLTRNLSVSKLELERMIGKPLDEVLLEYSK